MPKPRCLALRSCLPLCSLALVLATSVAQAAAPAPGPPLAIRRITGTISIDGDVSDAGWQGADSIRTWFETNPGDNLEPKVRNLAFMGYDERYFYAAFVLEDPNPGSVRAPLGDHDAVPGSTDYAGVIVDSRNDGKSALMFLANPNGVQYDAITNDVTGEDSSPDFFWEAVGKHTSSGWNLEMRIPFTSLRYNRDPEQTWGILLYRNYPRDRRYQFFTARLPRDVNCFICNSSKLTGLSNLPHGSHLVVAPFATGSQSGAPRDTLGTPIRYEDFESDFGLDLKWSPTANMAIDATVNPDFSQIESDQAQIVANERFALFFPEKRPFFLEGVDLLSTLLNATYTRTITDPKAGLRATGRFGSTSYTALVTQDNGGGIVILPGPQGSGDASQDFVSDVGVLRLRHDIGPSFVSLLTNTREIHGGGFNRVAGPDFNWRPRPSESIRGQFLWSETRTPDRPELAGEWDGRTLSDHAAQLDWSHSTRTVDWYLAGQDIGGDFRSFNGFLPQVGYREAYLDAGYTLRPKDAFLSRVRLFTTHYVDLDAHNDVLNQKNVIGSGMDGRWNSFFRVELNRDAIRVGEELLERFRPRLYLEASPSRVLNNFWIEAFVGEEIDFANARRAHGTTLNGSVSLRPSDHLELRGNASQRWLDVNAGTAGSGRLFVARVERLRGTWAFDARSFVRLIAQHVETKRTPSLYTFTVDGKSAGLSLSALFAYKLNWQTVVYLGYGDERDFAVGTGELEPSSRQFFGKVSYAWQH